ncbi:MAG TPA: nucleotidyltransferase family protein [Candidatus Paceibacterota bacterium]
MLIQEVTKKIEPLLRERGVSFAGLFGSRARGEERADSDFDILVKFKTPQSLFELIGLEHNLSKALEHDVDIVTEGALSPAIKPMILKDLQSLYGKR